MIDTRDLHQKLAVAILTEKSLPVGHADAMRTRRALVDAALAALPELLDVFVLAARVADVQRELLDGSATPGQLLMASQELWIAVDAARKTRAT